MREAPSLALIADLLGGRRARCAPTIPVREEARKISREQSSIVEIGDRRAARAADALAIVTEWQEFRSPDFAALKKTLKTPAIFDGRNLYDPAVLKAHGFEYYPIGRKDLKAPDTHAKARVLVVGDVMLDRYWFGDVSRISPEAPVPVVLIREEETGSAAPPTSRANCAALGARTHAAVGGRRRRRRQAAGEAARGEGVEASLHRDARIRHHAEAARHRAAAAAAAAHRLRDAAVARGARLQARRLQRTRCRTATWCILSGLRQGRPHAHRRA